ncbi:MAG: hypothetical protein WBD22_01335 [Pyrinomonadaceae bacterium]
MISNKVKTITNDQGSWSPLGNSTDGTSNTILFAEQYISRNHPGGVDLVVIGSTARPGVMEIKQPNWIIAILIGLLLPASQKVNAIKSSEITNLKPLLRPGGKIGAAQASLDQPGFILP